MRIQVVTPKNGSPAYIELQVGETGIIEIHPNKLICYGHEESRDEELPAYPEGYDINTKVGTLEDIIELRDAMHTQFGF